MAETSSYPVVLVEPWEPGNVGSICRAMGNFGVRDLRLVVEQPAHRKRLMSLEARRLATHGTPILESAKFYDQLPEALAGCGYAIGFSARTGRNRRPQGTFAETMASSRQMAATGTQVALVFGTEEKGLSAEHLTHVSDIARIPVPGEHSVLNLAQAVLLVLWELVREDQIDVAPEMPAEHPMPIATVQSRASLRAEWHDLLQHLGYQPTGRGTLHRRVLRRIMDMFDRSGGHRRDGTMLRGVATAIRRLANLPKAETGSSVLGKEEGPDP